MTGSKHIHILQVCSIDYNESKYFLVNKNLLHVCSTDEGKSKSIIADEFSTEEIESECVHRSVNKEKYSKNEAEHEETLITDNPVFYEPSCFNIFKCGENLLNKLDATCE